jgi:enoyl-CoA hydratase/carnithine racemase
MADMNIDIDIPGVSVDRRGAVTIVRIDRGENRFHPAMLDAIESVLDAIEDDDQPCALVLTGTGKFFSNGLDHALITARLDPAVAHRAMVTAHRFTGEDALAAGIVAELAPEDEVLDRAVAHAEALAGKPRDSLGEIKRGMYAGAIATLAAP